MTVVLAGLLAGCGASAPAASASASITPSSSSAASLSPIRIGAVYALSGDSAAIGTNILRGIDFAVAEINEAGGVNGHPLEVVRADTRGDAQRAAELARTLIEEEGAAAILGCHQSAATEQVFAVCEEEEVPALTAISTVDALTTPDSQYCFRLCPRNSQYFEKMFEYLSAQQEQTGQAVHTIAVFADNSLIGQEAIRDIDACAPAYDMEIVERVTYSHGAYDLHQEVAQLAQADADAVLVECYVSDAILLMETMQELNYKPPIMLAKANGFTDPSFLSACADLAEGLTSAVEWNDDMVKGAEVNARFYDIFGVDMNGHSAEAYTAVWVLRTAFAQAADFTGPSVAEALRNLDIQGSFPDGPEILLPYDEIRFETVEVDGVLHANENVCADIAIAQIQDGKYRTVWPYENADAAIVWPASFQQ